MAIDTEWERFYGGPSVPTSKRYHVTMSPDKKFQMNANMWRQMGSPDAVYLFFNRTRDKVAIQPASPRLPDAFPVRVRGNTYVIYAAPFFNHYNIRLNATHKFLHPELDENYRLILNLTETILATRIPRRRKTNSE